MLMELTPKVRKRACRKAAREALAPLVREIRAAAPTLTGALRKSIKFWFSLRKGMQARSGIRVKDSAGDKSAFAGDKRLPPSVYAWWVEAGHGVGRASRAVRSAMRRARGRTELDSRGRTRAFDFMGGPWRAAEDRTLKTYMDTLREGIAAIWDRG